MCHRPTFSNRLGLVVAAAVVAGLVSAPAGAFAGAAPRGKTFTGATHRAGAFTVTAATASVSPPSYSGPCPKTFTFKGTITTDGPGTVTYSWSHVPYVFGERTVTFARAGTQAVNYTLTMDSEWPAGEGHWVDLLIRAPNFVNAGQVAFQLQCSNQTPGPRPVSVTLRDGSPAVIIGDRLWLVKPGRQVPAPDGTYELNTGEKLVVRGFKIIKRLMPRRPPRP